jgi:hypothetical protein
MGRYLVLWETDEAKIPLDPKVRRESWLAGCEMVRQDIKSGLIKDWGYFLGQTKGFAINEGIEEEVGKAVLKYIPYFRFQVFPIRTVDQLVEAIKTMK